MNCYKCTRQNHGDSIVFPWIDKLFDHDNLGTIGAIVTKVNDSQYHTDVRGPTCPGYLLSINREVDKLDKNSKITLLASYFPCESDVKIWCNSKGYTFLKTTIQEEHFEINIIN